MKTTKEEKKNTIVWLSSYPSEDVMKLYIDKAKNNKSKTLIIDFPVDYLDRYQASITIE